MASYIEIAEYIGLSTESREAAKKFVEAFAAENEIGVDEIFKLYNETAAGAHRERELEGYFDY